MSNRAKHLRADTGGVDRRQFLRRAAVVGTAAWAVPTIVSIDVAGAQQVTSPPPTHTPPADVGAGAVPTAPAVEAVGPASGTQVAGRTALPFTGAELDKLAVAGLAATAGGAALLLWSAEIEK